MIVTQSLFWYEVVERERYVECVFVFGLFYVLKKRKEKCFMELRR